MKNRIILIMAAVVLACNLCGCESKQKFEDKTSSKKEAVKEKSGDNITESPAAATIKPVEKLDMAWLEPGIIPQDSITLEFELAPGETAKKEEYKSSGTAIPVMIYQSGGQGFGYGFIDGSGNIIFYNTYDFVDYPNSELIRAGQYNEGDYTMKFGFIDQKREDVIPFEYDDASNFSDGLAKVGKRNDAGTIKYGYINQSGEKVAPCEYDEVDEVFDFRNGLAKVGKRNDAGTIKYGYINQSGEEIIPCEYDEAKDFSCGLAAVAKYKEVYDGNQYKYKELKYGFINKTGKRVIPLKYNFAMHFCKYDFFENPIAKVQTGSKQGYIDTTGKTVIPFKYSLLKDYVDTEGLLYAQIDGKEGYIDLEGKEVIPFLPSKKYSYNNYFVGGLVYKMKKEGDSPADWKAGFLDQKGNVVIPIKEWYNVPYSSHSYANGLVKLAKNKKGGKKKLGFLDKNGTEVIPAKYDMADDFNDILTRVGKGEDMKYGALDRNGKIVIPIQYDEMTSFTKGLSVVGQRDDMEMKYGVFDINGKMLIEIGCDEICIINEGRYGYVKKGEKYGVFKNPYYEAS